MKTISCVILLAFLFSRVHAQTSPHGAIRAAYSACHTTDSWRMRSDAQFDHASTGFPLAGAHKATECASCHQGFRFAGTKSTCQSCHTDIHKGELGNDCARCHSTAAWLVADMRQRHQQTRFPLVGKHAVAECKACHASSIGIRYAGIPTACIGCHREQYAQSQNPNHQTAGFSTNCALCHRLNAVAWGSGFDHALTKFPLTGSHRAAACNGCHTKTPLSSAPTACYDCHSKPYTEATNPNHTAAQFARECQVCHTTAGWSPSSYSHDGTGFSLAGAHRSVECSKCHVNNQYAGLSKQCIDCHRADYTSTTSPSHIAGGFPMTCADCHAMNGWSPAAFDHATTKFSLTGKHTTTKCSDCHTSGNYQLLFIDCYQCHQTEYQKPLNPNHAAGGFAHDCATCHSTVGWTPSTFSHATTTFPLVGAHLSVSCDKCHLNNKFTGLSHACIDCHQTDYTNSTNPIHLAGGFPTTCADCHGMNGWSPASFDHSSTRFLLTGAHASVSCQSCHVNGNYQLAFGDCYQCHQADFQRLTNPNHATQSFPHNCVPCHSTVAWTPLTYNHDVQYFKIYSGKHQGRWRLCTDCHTSPSVFSSFTCLTCHTQTSMAQDHSGVANYVYASANCYSCHAKV